MEITRVKIRFLKNPVTSYDNEDDFVIGYCSLTFDNIFMVHGIKIVESRKGNIYIHMPKQKVKDKDKNKDKSFDRDYFHALDSSFRDYIKRKIEEEINLKRKM